MTPHQRKITAIVSILREWYRTNARDLPWRRTRDPYAVWVSEIMLQQTQVKTVVPYWERWLRELPTIQSLAAAPPEKIHKLWEGLGYYTRVRNLQMAAHQIVAQHDGKFPRDFDAALALPGIGRYTAGAICSIAFNQPAPILDGNVIRVLTRIFGISENPKEKKTNAQLWQLAEELVSRAKNAKPMKGRNPSQTSRPSRESNSCSHLNQSLMELGALVCTPRQPKCKICPVNKLCVAFREQRLTELPNLGKRASATQRRFTAFVVERDGKFLVRQRPGGVVNAHLWEFPNVEVGAVKGRARHSVRAATPQTENGAQRTDAPYHAKHFRIIASKPLCTIKHSITRYRITLAAYRAESVPRKKPAGAWRTAAEMEKLAFPSAHRKILAKLAD